jgi:lipoprotein-releasing system permease protein
LNVAAFIARRVAFNRERSFSRFIIRLAITATAISIAAMLLTFAFTKGFQYTVAQKVFSLWGHIRVQYAAPNRAAIAEELPVMENDTVLHILRADKDIKSIGEYAVKNAVLRSREGIQGILLKGVQKGYDFSNMNGFLKSGRWIHWPDSGYSSEINISAYMADQLRLNVGDKLLIYFIQPQGSPRVRQLTVAGIFKIGIEDFDKLVAIGDLRLIQRLSNWAPNEISGYEVFVKDYQKADTISSRLYDELPITWSSRTLMEITPNIFDWLNLQDVTILIVLIIMTVIATLNLVTCLIILVLERTRMIGILKAIGAPTAAVQRIFLYQGAIITLFGMVIGNAFGLLIYWLQNKYAFIKLPEEAYFISKAIGRLEWWHLVVVNGGTFLISFLILMIPTLIVRKMQPARAIQFR